jgi:hypothetical protein
MVAKRASSLARGMTLVSRVALPAVIVALFAPAACGARTGLPVPLTDAGESPDAPSCKGKDLPLLVNAPNLYFVLDTSGSMNEMNKWTNVRSVVADLITQLGTRARFGAATFPGQGTDVCGPGTELLPLQLGDSNGTLANEFLAATSFKAAGGTPTADTLLTLVPELQGFAGTTFAILATDGGPNCDPNLTCDVNSCTANMDGLTGCPPGGPPNCCDPAGASGPSGCLDGARAMQAVAALKAAGIETFVIGIPGSAPYAAVLDQLAQAGGTARGAEPLYYRVDTADTEALGGVLAQIAAKTTAACTFGLSRAPADLNLVNVYVGGSIVPRDGPDGWTLTSTTLTLEGATCDAIKTGRAVSVRVVEGCPTVTH